MPDNFNKSISQIQTEVVVALRRHRVRTTLSIRTVLAFALAVIAISLGAESKAQSKDGETQAVSSSPSLADASLEEIQAKYSEATEKLRSSLKALEAAKVRYFNSPLDSSEEHRQSWQQAADEGKVHFESLRNSSMELFRRQNRPPEDVIELALRSGLDEVNLGRYSVGLEILKRANSISPSLQSETFMARVQLLDNEFEAAKAFFVAHPDQLESMSETETELYQSIDQMISKFNREKQLRAEEAKTDDLPRVELLTSEGKIVLELFENEAPETVANFIYLVEQRFYDGVIFHNVKDEFVAQAGGFGVVQVGGKPRIAPRGVNYTIYDEKDKPNARKHFRGSLSMANQNAANTASSYFILSLTPQPFLDDNHTVFGRVIEGMSVMSDLTATFQEGDEGKDEPIADAVPSVILSAKVIRKRDHDYQPVKVDPAKQNSSLRTDKSLKSAK